MHTLPAFSAWLRQIRVERGLTQAQLAAAAGCSVSLIRKYESDARRPTRTITLRLAAALQLSDTEQAQFVHMALNGAAPPPVITATTPLPGWIPAPPTPIIGREQALAHLVEMLVRAPGRLVTLVGPPGVGKSRLALACASAVDGRFADGIWFIELAALTSTHELMTTIAARLGITLQGDNVAALSSALHGRHLLLGLDNFEHLLDAAPSVAQLLREVPKLTILTTSRIPLRIRAEQCVMVEPLGLPRSATITAVAAAPAAQLFCERAAAIMPGFQLSTANVASIAGLCHRLDGLPLAIELVAANSDQFSPDALLERIRRRLSGLEGRVVDLPPHQQTLSAMIAWSVQLLPAAARRSFTRLGVFAGSFDATLATRVGVEHLDLLVEHHLVQPSGRGRYRLLETLRAYAAACLADDPAAAVHAAYAQSLAELAEAYGRQLNTPQHGEALATLNEQLPDLRNAISWSVAHDAGLVAARITVALRFYWLSAGAVQEGRRIERFLQETGGSALPQALLAKTYLTLGYLASQQADGVCVGLLERGVALAHQHELRAEIAPARYLQAILARYPGNLERCRTLLNEAIVSARALGDDYHLAAALNELGTAYSENREPRTALTYFEEALVVAARLGRTTIVRRYESDRAAALADLGDTRQARQIFERICHEERADDYSALWETQLRLARLDMAAGALDRAGDLLEAAAAAIATMGIHYGLTMLLRNQGHLALLRADEAEARRLLKTAYNRAVSSMFLEEIATTLIGLALVDSAIDLRQSARQCGAFEGLLQRFPLRIDPLTSGFHEQVRGKLGRAESELAEASAHIVCERIHQAAFPDNYTAQTTFQLARVLAAALRAC
jgi:predicted ATPase/transcriptional regulator with XRE-family HTH domain